ncbi:hypothetical protein TPHV1_20020 [Treponema phagedenis]|uniref:Uncharacterized protein n=1 Tax=Treponema phagedenis TaxID=162 RepID=A0A0B7GSM8_TREPH|nr:hypothetical protein TPHV1_20020 [Treponema phagedenis]
MQTSYPPPQHCHGGQWFHAIAMFAQQTRRLAGYMDGKLQNRHGRRWFHAKTSLKTTTFVR